MKINVIGKAHLEGVAKKTGKPYDFIQLHYVGLARGVEGKAALTLSLDPSQYPYERITVPGDYVVDFDGKGFPVDFAPAPAASK